MGSFDSPVVVLSALVRFVAKRLLIFMVILAIVNGAYAALLLL